MILRWSRVILSASADYADYYPKVVENSSHLKGLMMRVACAENNGGAQNIDFDKKKLRFKNIMADCSGSLRRIGLTNVARPTRANSTPMPRTPRNRASLFATSAWISRARRILNLFDTLF